MGLSSVLIIYGHKLVGSREKQRSSESTRFDKVRKITSSEMTNGLRTK